MGKPSIHTQRRQLREVREASGFASIFFAGVGLVALVIAWAIGALFGSSGELFWWIFMVGFTVCTVVSGVALFHWFDAGHDLGEMDR